MTDWRAIGRWRGLLARRHPRALAKHPPLLLADEPTANLDSRNGSAVMELLSHLARAQGTGVVVVSHDTRLEHLADSVLWLEDGRLQEPDATRMPAV